MADQKTLHQTEDRIFGETEELAIISLALDMPEFFSSVSKHIRNEHFRNPSARFVYAIIEKAVSKHDIIPTREIVKDIACRHLTTGDDYEPVIALIDRKSDPREAPAVKESVIKFAKQRAFNMLYTQEIMEAVSRGQFDQVEEIIDDANKITDISQSGVWFFERIGDLFMREMELHYTTGFPKLDRLINDGGPTRSDVFSWMAPTNVGKTLILCNTGEANVRNGKNVLHISLEGDIRKIQVRYAGIFSNLPITTLSHRIANRQAIETSIRRCAASTNAELVLYQFAADELDINTIRQTIDYLRRNKKFHPDVLIIDYMELMISRNRYYNRDDYIRQKAIATELCHLADKEGLVIFTATQTNRHGVKEDEDGKKNHIDLDKIAESFGKTMPVSYIVSINQSKEEYESGYDKDHLENTNARARFFIAKNRNGPKSEAVAVRINYTTMKAVEEEPLPSQE